jgi:hypothetical protein
LIPDHNRCAYWSTSSITIRRPCILLANPKLETSLIYALLAPDAAARSLPVGVRSQYTQVIIAARRRSDLVRSSPTSTRDFEFSNSTRRCLFVRPCCFCAPFSSEHGVKPYKIAGLRLRLPTDLRACKAAHHLLYAGSQSFKKHLGRTVLRAMSRSSTFGSQAS